MWKAATIGGLVGLPIALLIVIGYAIVSQAQTAVPAGNFGPSTYESARELHDRLAGTDAACDPFTPDQPLHDALDAANCRILGVNATLATYASHDGVERTLKGITGRGAGKYSDWYIARVAGENWIVAVGGLDRDRTLAVAQSVQKVVGGDIDTNGW